MMLFHELMLKNSECKVVRCVDCDPESNWVKGILYAVEVNRRGEPTLRHGGLQVTHTASAFFEEVELAAGVSGYAPNINPHMKDGKLPTLITGFNPNIVAVDECKQVRTCEELENLIRVGIDIQAALATNAPNLDRALVDLWFELKGTKQ